MFYDFLTKYTDIFVEKMRECKSFLHFFNKKYWHIWDTNIWIFNVLLTNDIVSFEQPGPGLLSEAVRSRGCNLCFFLDIKHALFYNFVLHEKLYLQEKMVEYSLCGL